MQRVELVRFDQPRLAALIAAILGVEPRSDLVTDVFDRSDGNPFFAEELLAARRPGTTGPRLPPTLREILLAHIASAPDSAQPVLGVAAVAGRRVEHDLLARVAGLPQDELLDGLRAAVGGNLLVIEAEDGVERYAFRHALVQEVAYDELMPGERRARHRAFAEALEALAAGSGTSDAGHLAELSHHWAAAHEDARAFEASVRAGDAAISSFAFGAALQEFERALDLWDGLADPAELAGFDRVELLRRAGLAAYMAADYRRTVAHRREAIAADTVADPVRAGLLREELGRALWLIGDTVGSLAAYRDAVETIPVEPPTAERARALSGLGQILMLQAKYVESRALCEEAISIARTVGARAQEGHALNTYGNDLAALGDCEGGAAALREALEIAREVRNADDVGRAYVNLTEEMHDCGHSSAALAEAYEGIRTAEELGIGHSYGYYIRLGGVSTAYALGRWDEASQLLSDAIARAPSGTGAERYRLSESLRLLVSQGSEAADAGLERADELIDDVSEAQFMGPVHTAGAERELWRHSPRAALAYVERALDSLVGTDDQVETAHLCRIGAWAAADLADEGRASRDGSAVTDARAWFERLDANLARVEGAGLGDGYRRELAVDRATLEAESSRLDGVADATAWAGSRTRGRNWSDRTSLPARTGARRRRRSWTAIDRLRRVPCRQHTRRLRASAPGHCAMPSKHWDAGPGSARRPWKRHRRCTRGRRGPVRIDPARARGAHAAGGWSHEPSDRRGPVHQREHGRRPRVEHPRQARGGEPGRGGRGRVSAGADVHGARGGISSTGRNASD